MNLKNKPPVFVPAEFRGEIEKLSKAALMDMVWDYARQVCCAESLGDPDNATMNELRERRDIILAHRA